MMRMNWMHLEFNWFEIHYAFRVYGAYLNIVLEFMWEKTTISVSLLLCRHNHSHISGTWILVRIQHTKCAINKSNLIIVNFQYSFPTAPVRRTHYKCKLVSLFFSSIANCNCCYHFSPVSLVIYLHPERNSVSLEAIKMAIWIWKNSSENRNVTLSPVRRVLLSLRVSIEMGWPKFVHEIWIMLNFIHYRKLF